MDLLKQFLALEARTINWVSADGSMRGVDDYARDWNETVKNGGTLGQLATRWGITPNEASRRAQVLLTKYDFKLANFSHHRGVRQATPDSPSVRSSSWTPQTIDPKHIVDTINNHGGNISKAAVELGMSYSTLYNLKRKIEAANPGLQIGRISRAGRPRNDPEAQAWAEASPVLGKSRMHFNDPQFQRRFARIWNSAMSKPEAYELFAVENEKDPSFPLFTPDKVNWLAWKIGKLRPDLLNKHPDQRRERWRLKKELEAQAQPVETGTEVTKELTPEEQAELDDLYSMMPEPSLENEEPPLPEPSVEQEDEEFADVTNDDLASIMGMDVAAKAPEAPEKAPGVISDDDLLSLLAAEEPAEPDVEPDIDPDSEFVQIWNSSPSKEEAKKKLKRAGWSSLAIDHKVGLLKSRLKKLY